MLIIRDTTLEYFYLPVPPTPEAPLGGYMLVMVQVRSSTRTVEVEVSAPHVWPHFSRSQCPLQDGGFALAFRVSMIVGLN